MLAAGCRSTTSAVPETATTPTTGAATSSTSAAFASFLEARRAHPTVLRERSASFETLGTPQTPPGATAVRYRSGDLELLAWFARPPGAGPHPLLVYFHGGFALAPSDFEKVRVALEAGWAVMTPSWRGENGNGGAQELLWGELDDALAAIAWASAQPDIDRARVHVLGHSVGGGLAALVSLVREADVVETASVGGLYVPTTFERWSKSYGNQKLVRFDPTVASERELRVLGPNLAHMVHPHVAYIGRDDTPFLDNARDIADAAARIDAPLQVVYVDGDHDSSLVAAIAAWVAAHPRTP